MKTKEILFTTLFILILASPACKRHNQTLLPPCTGRPGEVVLILADDLYKGAIGDTLMHYLTQEEPALPSSGMEGAEPMFDVVHLPPSGFSNIIRPARNLLIIDVDRQYTQPEITALKDFWARDQILIKIDVPDKEQLITTLLENKDFIISTLRDGEVTRQEAISRQFANEELSARLLRSHEIIMSFPKGFDIRLDTGHFAWIHFDPADMTLGMLIWDYPYTDQAQMSYPELISYADQHLKPRVPGPSRGSYMSLNLNIPVMTRNLTVNGNFVTELRGLWETVGDFMGGPFISWSYVDEQRNRIVTAFGYVYAPKIGKRNQVRKLEGILRTVDFPDQGIRSNN